MSGITERLRAGSPAFLVAEMAWAHDGSGANALTIADAAVDACVDALNVHLTSLPDYMVRDYGSGPGRVSAGKETEPVFDYLQRISLTAEDLEAVAKRVHDGGVALSVMCNDVPSLAQARSLHADLLTVPPAALAERAYLEAVAEENLPTMLGVGGATLAEIERALETLGREEDIALQWGVQAYPTDPEVLDLRWLETLRVTFGLPVLYHDHTEAGSSLAEMVPMAALGVGVAGIEKHVTYDRAVRGEDFESALDPAELVRFAADVRAVERALGDGRWRPLGEAELAYRDVVRKRGVAREAIAAGTTLAPEHIAFKRADGGLAADDLDRFVGRTLTRSLERDDPIAAEAFD